MDDVILKKSVTAVGYPTIPVIFLAGVNENRVPLYDTMGLAVTDLKAETRSETVIAATEDEGTLEFLLEGRQMSDQRRLKDIDNVINVLMLLLQKH